MSQISTPFYLQEPLFKNILSYCGLTNKEKLINQLNLFEKDWYEDYCDYLTEIIVCFFKIIEDSSFFSLQ